MAAHLINTRLLPFPLHRTVQMLLYYFRPLPDVGRRQVFAGLYKMLDFVKNPGVTDSGPANHNPVHAIAFLISYRFLRRINITIAKDGNLYAGIVFYFGNRAPVGHTFIQLAASTAMNGEG